MFVCLFVCLFIRSNLCNLQGKGQKYADIQNAM